MMVGYVGVAGGVTPVTCFTLNDGRICGCGSCDMFYSERL